MLPRERTLTQYQKEEILIRDVYTCIYCGDIATEVDHVCPWSWSQCDDPLNLVASCSLCNRIAYNMVFNSLIEKTKYIHAARKHKHHPKKADWHYCTECRTLFFPCVKGATNFLCKDCAKAQDRDDEIITEQEGTIYALA